MTVTRRLVWIAAGVVVLGGVTAGAAAVAFGSDHHGVVADSGSRAGAQDDSIFARSGEAQASSAPVASDTAVAGASSLKPGGRLSPRQWLRSPNGRYALLQQPDGNLVEYENTKKALWSAQTGNHPGAYLLVQPDGNAVVYAPDGTPLWNSGTTGTRAGTGLTLQNDGNVVVPGAGGTTLWASQQETFTLYPSQALLPGQQRTSPNGRYHLLAQPDGNVVEYDGTKAVWSAQTSGHSGAYAYLGGDGNFVVYAANKSPLYSTATWQATGASLMVRNDGNVAVVRADKTAVWATLTQGVSMLMPGQTLTAGQFRQSPNGVYRLLQQPDGNLVEYKSTSTAVWSAKTGGNAGAVARMQTDSNLVVYSAAGKALWNSATTGKKATFLTVQNDGSVALYNASKQVLWSTGAH